MAPVIVFGPTGNIGSWAARTARELGADVVLAMRDTSKPIKGLDESKGGFERVQADLSQPESVSAAVRKTEATRAFIYAIHSSGDHMKSAIEALKSAGVQFVVYLSSFTVYEPLENIQPKDFISYLHGKIEISLEEVYGKANFVAVRPGGFATNLLRYKPEIVQGNVGIFGRDFKQDNITPDDMGKVSGRILVEGPKDNQHTVYLYGPDIMSHEESLAVIGRVLGKDIKTHDLAREDFIEQQGRVGVPKTVANYLADAMEGAEADSLKKLGNNTYDEGLANVERYTGQPAKTFEEWVSENKELFSS